MAILDPTQPIGKMRLRVGDYSDMPLLPDSVYQSALDDNNGSVPRACKLVCQYILGMLTAQTHQKLSQIEVFGAEWFSNYVTFIKTTITNPDFMDFIPMPYEAQIRNEYGELCDLPLVQFQKDWNRNYVTTTQSQDMHLTALPQFRFGSVVSNPFGSVGAFDA